MKTNVLRRAGIISCISLLYLTGVQVKAQIGTSYIEVKIINDDLRANGTNGLQTKNNALNTILAQYGAQKYAQFYKGAQTPGLTEYYGIEFTGNANDFKNALMATNGFESAEIRAYAELANKNSDYPKPNSIGTKQASNSLLYPVNDPYILTHLNGTTEQASKYPIDLMKLKYAWDITEGNEDIAIAFVDTEFDIYHEDLQGKYKLPITNLVPGAMTQTPHGTATSGIAIAKVNNNKGIAGVGNKTMGAGYIANGGMSLPDGIWQAYLDGYRIINVSWTGTGLSPQAVLEMTQNGVTLVVSAGNSIGEMNHTNIANIPGVIMVSGHDMYGNIGSMNTARNSNVDIVAPASTVLAPRNNSTGLLYSYSNNSTSIAAPQVCGVVALIKAVNPCLSPVQIENIIKSSAAPVGDGASYPGLYGAGRVDAYQAVVSAQSTGTNTDITSNTTYNIDKVVYGNIIVHTGSTLTITAKIKMGCRGKISVQPGAKLLIDGGEVTSLTPGTLWRGIELWGNRNMPSNPQYHGTLEMRNNAKVSYAANGVLNFSEGNYAEGGGIIKVSDSKFINCRRAVGLNDYPLYSYWTDINAGLSNCSFTNTEFLIDDKRCLYTSDSQTMNDPYLITSWQTKDGIVIKNCTFKSLLTDDDIVMSSHRGTAVHLAESGALVKENHFEGYTRGVTVTSVTGTPSHTVKVYKNTIKSNVIGILVAANANTDIRANRIPRMAKFAPNVQHNTGGYNGVGIYVDQSSGTYIGCNNDIAYEESTENPTGIAPWNTYGIVFNKSAIGGNTVSTNTFAKLGRGIYTLDDNRNLNILNNTFGSRVISSELYFDWSGAPFKSLGAGCAANPLLTNKVAGNIFTDTGSYLFNFYTNPSIAYYYKIGAVNQQPVSTSGAWNMTGCNSSTTPDLACTVMDVSPGGPVLVQKMSRYQELVNNQLRFSAECEELVGDIIRIYNDESNVDQLKTFLNEDHTLDADLLLMPLAIETEDYGLYDVVKNRLDKDILGEDQKNTYIAYYDLLRDLKMSERHFEEMTPAELDLVTNIAHSTHGVSGLAKALLDQLGIEEWIHIVNDNDPYVPSMSRMAGVEKENLLLISPNPAVSTFSISIKDVKEDQDIEIRILDIYGRLVLRKGLKGTKKLMLDAKGLGLREGMYLVQAESRGAVIGVQKLVVKF